MSKDKLSAEDIEFIKKELGVLSDDTTPSGTLYRLALDVIKQLEREIVCLNPS